MDSKERERYNMRKKAIYDEISDLENAEKKDWSKEQNKEKKIKALKQQKILYYQMYQWI